MRRISPRRRTEDGRGLPVETQHRFSGGGNGLCVAQGRKAGAVPGTGWEGGRLRPGRILSVQWEPQTLGETWLIQIAQFKMSGL